MVRKLRYPLLHGFETCATTWEAKEEVQRQDVRPWSLGTLLQTRRASRRVGEQQFCLCILLWVRSCLRGTRVDASRAVRREAGGQQAATTDEGGREATHIVRPHCSTTAIRGLDQHTFRFSVESHALTFGSRRRRPIRRGEGAREAKRRIQTCGTPSYVPPSTTRHQTASSSWQRRTVRRARVSSRSRKRSSSDLPAGAADERASGNARWR